MAYKKPVKFYEKVMRQKVTEHKVQRAKTFTGDPGQNELPQKKIKKVKKGKSLELRSRVTLRAICRILFAVQRKLEKLVVPHVDDEAVTPDDIKRAMSHPATQEVVQKHVAKGNVKLVHKDSLEPVFEKQMSEIGERGAAVAQGPSNADDTLLDCDPDDAKLVSFY